MTAERCNVCGRPLVELEAVGRGVCLPTCDAVGELEAAFDREVGDVIAAPSEVMRRAIAGASIGHARHGAPGAVIGGLFGGVLGLFERRQQTLEARAAAQDELEEGGDL